MKSAATWDATKSYDLRRQISSDYNSGHRSSSWSTPYLFKESYIVSGLTCSLSYQRAEFSTKKNIHIVEDEFHDY